MGIILRDCPHCHAKNSSFTGFADSAIPNTKHQYLTAFFCGSCHSGIFLETILNGQNKPPTAYIGNIEYGQGFILSRQYPELSAIGAPNNLSKNIETFFIQAAKNLKTKNYDASSMMARKTLEVAVKQLNPTGKGNLYKRIEDLHKNGSITDDLKDWAHIIRDDGNEAAHEEEPVSEKFAEELLSFTELFLMYTFTMPGMVKTKRGISEEEQEESEAE